MPVSYPGVQYSGIWTLQQAHDAIAASTWPIGSPQYLYGWGTNNYGQLGLGNTTYAFSSPQQVGSLATWKSVTSKYFNTTALKSDGTLWAWGYNNNGQLGLGNTTSYSSPKQVGALTAWSKIRNGAYHTLSIKTDGTLWTWGYNTFGQLGLGNINFGVVDLQR